MRSGSAKGIGKVKLNLLQDDGSVDEVNFEAYYSPETRFDLLSPCKLRRHIGVYYSDRDFSLHGLVDDTRCGRAFFHVGVPFVSHLQSRLKEDIVAATAVPLHLVYRRLDHAGLLKLKTTIKGIGLEAKNEDFPCEAWALGKSRKVILRAKKELTLQTGDFFYFDIQKVRPAGRWVDKGGRTISGFEFTLVVIDDKTRMRTVILLRKKSDASEQLIRFCEYVKNLRKGVYPHECRHDGDPSFNRFVDYLKEISLR